MHKMQNNFTEPSISPRWRKLFSKEGYSLPEILIVVAIIGIIAIIGGPTVRKMLANLQVKGEAQQLYNALQNARLRAIRANMNAVLKINPTTVCSSSQICPAGRSCYRIFLDANANSTCDAGETILSDVVMDNGFVLTTPVPIPPAPVGSTGFMKGDGFTPRGLPITPAIRTVEVKRTDNKFSTAKYLVTLNPAGSATLGLE